MMIILMIAGVPRVRAHGRGYDHEEFPVPRVDTV